MRKFWFILIIGTAIIGMCSIYSDGHNQIKVSVEPLGMTPRQHLAPNDPNLNLIPENLRDVNFDFVYRGQWSLENISRYRAKHPNEPAIISSSSGSFRPGTTTMVFSNNPSPDPEFFQQ